MLFCLITIMPESSCKNSISDAIANCCDVNQYENSYCWVLHQLIEKGTNARHDS